MRDKTKARKHCHCDTECEKQHMNLLQNLSSLVTDILYYMRYRLVHLMEEEDCYLWAKYT